MAQTNPGRETPPARGNNGFRVMSATRLARMLDTPLSNGILFRDATREEVEAEIRMLKRKGTVRRASDLPHAVQSRIIADMPAGARVGEVLGARPAQQQ